jgi:hypothetical protein
MTSILNEPTNPEWPMNVMVFHPTNSIQGIQDIKDKIEPTEDTKKPYNLLKRTENDPHANIPLLDGDGKQVTGTTYTSKKHFSTKHYALLFAPGEYKDCKFEVGYYVQMAGLGKSPTDVKFTGDQSGPFVEALNKDMKVTEGGSIAQNNAGLCLDTFWRSAENFTSENCQWAVSQAAPLRNVVVNKELMMGDGAAYSSGGFIANAQANGNVSYAANQQWFSRAVQFGGENKPAGGSWSTCFSGML